MKQIFLDVACALEVMHSLVPPVVHGDVKANNVFVIQNGAGLVMHAVLGDFGSACVMDGSESSLGSAVEDDVFQFGIMLARVRCARHALDCLCSGVDFPICFFLLDVQGLIRVLTYGEGHDSCLLSLLPPGDLVSDLLRGEKGFPH